MRKPTSCLPVRKYILSLTSAGEERKSRDPHSQKAPLQSCSCFWIRRKRNIHGTKTAVSILCLPVLRECYCPLSSQFTWDAKQRCKVAIRKIIVAAQRETKRTKTTWVWCLKVRPVPWGWWITGQESEPNRCFFCFIFVPSGIAMMVILGMLIWF